MLMGKRGRSKALPGRCAGEAARAAGGTQPGHPVCGIAAGAPVWVQLRAGHPEKGTLAPQPPWRPRGAAPHHLQGLGLQAGKEHYFKEKLGAKGYVTIGSK